MQIILQEDVEKLGTRGEVVEVAAGYARNYLLPHKLALEASPANIKRLEKIRITLSKRTATEKDAAQQQAALLNQVTVKFARKAGETDQLFGSVTSGDLADALKAQGFEIDKRRIAARRADQDPRRNAGHREARPRRNRGIQSDRRKRSVGCVLSLAGSCRQRASAKKQSL